MMISSTMIDPAPASTSEATPFRSHQVESRPPRHFGFGIPALERRFSALLLRHARLDRQLRGAAKGPYRDGFAIQRLKRLKLRVKDEMALLKSVLRAELTPAMSPENPQSAPVGNSRYGAA